MIEIAFLSDAECDEVLRLAATCPMVRPGRETGHAGESKGLRFPTLPGWLAERLDRALRFAAEELGMPPVTLYTAFQKCSPRVAVYSRGCGFRWHADVHPGQRGLDGTMLDTLSWVSCSVQLSPSDAYEGGDLALIPYTSKDTPTADDLKRTMRVASRKRGSATLFDSLHVHAVTKVTAGERHSLVAWGDGPRP